MGAIVVYLCLLLVFAFFCAVIVLNLSLTRCPACGRRSVLTTRKYTGADSSYGECRHYLVTARCLKCDYTDQCDICEPPRPDGVI